METRSGILDWRIPWTEDPGSLQFMGSHRVGHDWVTEHACIWDLRIKVRKTDMLTLSLLIYEYRMLLLFCSCSIVSDSLQPHGLQHTRLPCSSLSPEVCSNSCPLSQWCNPTIISSVVSFSSCPPSFPASYLFICLDVFWWLQLTF